MILSIYDFKTLVLLSSLERFEDFVQECLLLDDEGVVEFDNTEEHFKAPLLEMEV